MKYLWLVTTLFVSSIICAFNAQAITTIASDGALKQAAPFLISAYSFQGSTVRYVQIYNSDNEPAALDGWKLSSGSSSGVVEYPVVLSGVIPPKRYVTIASSSVLPSATFVYPARVVNVAEPLAQTISLTPPQKSNLLPVSVTVSVSSSTPRDQLLSPTAFYFTRNVSTTSGEYLSTFSASASAPTSLMSDPLYEIPDAPPLRIVELYPDADSCSPLDSSKLCSDYVKLKNVSDLPIDLSKYRLRTGSLGQASTPSNTIILAGLLGPGEYISPVISLSASGNWVWIEDLYGYQIYDNTVANYPSSSGHEKQSYSYDDATNEWKWNMNPRPGNQPNFFEVPVAVNGCAGLKLSEIAPNTDKQYIEVYNAADNPIDISGCQIQTNRSSTQSYIFPEGINLSSGAFFTLSIPESNLTLTKTTSGTVYLLTSDGKTEIDARKYDKLKVDTSYSLIDGQWLQSYAMTPGATNIYLQYPTCEIGYERNYQTGNCNKIPSTSSLLAACDVGEYRSGETNRCRKLTSTSSTGLTACSEGQYRSLETNRCRNIVTASSELKPCASNQERNPETNRCRLASSGSIPEADFPVDQKQSTANSPMGWVAFAAVGSLAVGYGVWEWRREIIGSFGSLLGKLHK